MKSAMIIFLGVMLFASTANAGVLTANFGVGLDTWSNGDNDGKHYGLAWSDSIPGLRDEILIEIGGGLFFPNNIGNSNPRGLFHLGFGAEVVIPSGPYFRAIMGPGWISKKGDRLGSQFQFIAKVGAGFESKSGVRIGPYYQHLSNGATSKGANLGRDWVGIEIGVKF